MSKAYKCDRCGCFFMDKKTVYTGAVKVEADFCSECVRSFEKWLKMDNIASEVETYEERTETHACVCINR